MRPRISAIALMVAASVVGCGPTAEHSPSEAVAKSIPGPKGGMALPIPGGRGYVEPLLERTGTGKARAGKVVLAAYIVGPDGAPAATLPDGVTASLTIPTRAEPVSVTLAPKAQGAGASATGRFATDPGDFDFDELRGELALSFGAETVTVPFAFR